MWIKTCYFLFTPICLLLKFRIVINKNVVAERRKLLCMIFLDPPPPPPPRPPNFYNLSPIEKLLINSKIYLLLLNFLDWDDTRNHQISIKLPCTILNHNLIMCLPVCLPASLRAGETLGLFWESLISLKQKYNAIMDFLFLTGFPCVFFVQLCYLVWLTVCHLFKFH